jgi:hypothetical protein
MSLYVTGSFPVGHPTPFELIASRNSFGIYLSQGRGYLICRLPSWRGATEFAPSSAIEPFPTLESAEIALQKWAAAPRAPRLPRKPKMALGSLRRNGHRPKFKGDEPGQLFLDLQPAERTS